MVLFVSEVCRLILGFLEQENLTKTYDTFLEECKYLEECRIYHKQSLKFCKTINGKTLKDYLLLKDAISYAIKSTQTDDFQPYETDSPFKNCDNLIGDNTKTLDNINLVNNHKSIVINDNINNNQILDIKKTNTNPNETISISTASNSTLRRLLFESDPNDPIQLYKSERKKNTNKKSVSKDESLELDLLPKTRKSNRKNSLSKRKSNLILTTPTKSQTQNCFPYQTTTNDSLNDTNYDQDFDLDIDVFIRSLCENNFPEKLAQSINELNIKKLGNAPSLDDVSKNISNLSCILNNNNLITANSSNNATVESQPIANNHNLVSSSNILESNIDNLDYDLLVKNETSLNQQILGEPIDPGFGFENNNTTNNRNILDSNSNKICIGKDDITFLAEFYTEPAAITLYEALNISRDNSIDKYQNPVDDNATTKNIKPTITPCVNLVNKNNSIEKKQLSTGDKRNESHNETIDSTLDNITDLNQTINIDESALDESNPLNDNTRLDESFLKYESENGDLSCSLTKNKKSFIIIAKSSDLIKKAEQNIKEGNFAYEKRKFDQLINDKKENRQKEKNQNITIENNSKDNIMNNSPLAHSSEKEHLKTNKECEKNKVETINKKSERTVRFNLNESDNSADLKLVENKEANLNNQTKSSPNCDSHTIKKDEEINANEKTKENEKQKDDIKSEKLVKFCLNDSDTDIRQISISKEKNLQSVENEKKQMQNFSQNFASNNEQNNKEANPDDMSANLNEKKENSDKIDQELISFSLDVSDSISESKENSKLGDEKLSEKEEKNIDENLTQNSKYIDADINMEESYQDEKIDVKFKKEIANSENVLNLLNESKAEPPLESISALSCLANVATNIIMNIEKEPSSIKDCDMKTKQEAFKTSKLLDEALQTSEVINTKTPCVSKQIINNSRLSPRKTKTIRAILENKPVENDNLCKQNATNKNNETNNIDPCKNGIEENQNQSYTSMITSTPLNPNTKAANDNSSLSTTPKKNKGSKRYFHDFYENIKDVDEDDLQENISNDVAENKNKKSRNIQQLDSPESTSNSNAGTTSSNFPSILSIAKKRQEELRARFKKNKLN